MSRICPYRREVSEACNWHQDQALNSTIYILYQTGPTGFLIKEDGDEKKFKVFLGDCHNCTCPVFKKEKDLCKHICWILLKKFRVSRSDPLSWQLGLNEREINQILRGDTAQTQQTRNKPAPKKVNVTDSSNPNEIEQKPITEEDICPICQDELLAKKLPVTHCRFGCGNNVHIKCMKVWADHQKSNGESQLKCPLCRENFCSFELLEQEYRNNSLFKAEKPDLHYGLVCKSCKASPISGKCYKCTVCAELYLCQACFNGDFHREHSFVFREKVNQKFRRATREHAGALPPAVVQNLANRELSEDDYDLLLQLESRTNNNSNSNEANFSQIPEKIIKSWPSEKVRESSLLLGPGLQCRVCLRPFQLNQLIRKLPSCKHKFHAECIDNWLLHSHPTCPIDGLVVWDPVTAQFEKEEKETKTKPPTNKQSSKKFDLKTEQQRIDFLSTGLLINYKTNLIESKQSAQTKLEQQQQQQVKSQNTKNTNKAGQRSSSFDASSNNDKKKKEKVKIEIEGHNLGMNLVVMADEEYPSGASGTSQLSMNPEAGLNNSRRNLKTIRSQIDLYRNFNNTIPSKSHLPNIEIKGNKLTNNDLATNFVLLNHNNNNNSEEMTNVLRRQNVQRNVNNELFSMNSLIKIKPYQLSRLSMHNNQAKTSDFNKETVALSSMDLRPDDYDFELYDEKLNEALDVSRIDAELTNHIEPAISALIKTNNFAFQLDEMSNESYKLNKQKFRMHHAALRKGVVNAKTWPSNQTGFSTMMHSAVSVDQLPVVAGSQLISNNQQNSSSSNHS